MFLSWEMIGGELAWRGGEGRALQANLRSCCADASLMRTIIDFFLSNNKTGRVVSHAPSLLSTSGPRCCRAVAAAAQLQGLRLRMSAKSCCCCTSTEACRVANPLDGLSVFAPADTLLHKCSITLHSYRQVPISGTDL